MQGPSWSKLAEIDIRKVDKEALTDIAGIKLDTSIPREQRGKHLMEKMNSLYYFKVGDIAVKVEFPPNAPTLQTCLTDFLHRKKGDL